MTWVGVFLFTLVMREMKVSVRVIVIERGGTRGPVSWLSFLSFLSFALFDFVLFCFFRNCCTDNRKQRALIRRYILETKFYIHPHAVYKVLLSRGKITCAKSNSLMISSHSVFNKATITNHQRQNFFVVYFWLKEPIVQNVYWTVYCFSKCKKCPIMLKYVTTVIVFDSMQTWY